MSSSDRLWPGEYFATIGVFDGLHLGHQAILRSLLASARSAALPTVLYTFQPRPVTVFAPETPPDELTPLPRKLRLLAESGIDRLCVLHFSRSFAEMEAETFLTAVLGAGAGLKGIWIGYDFRFGRGRRGDWRMLQEMSGRFGYRAHRVDAIRSDGEPVSSTRIRRLLRQGDLESARRLLGRWPDLEGVVVRGRGQGRRVLVPTANLLLPAAQSLPALGVYVGEAEWDGKGRPAVLNLGRRPTLTDGSLVVPEVHVLDFDGDLLGRKLLFRMRGRLREERSFRSLNELRDQVGSDLAEARRMSMGWEEEQTGLVGRPPDC